VNSLIKMDSDDIVNMNDEYQKQRLELETILTVSVSSACFFIAQPIVVIPFKLRMLANNRSLIFSVKAMAGSVTFRDYQYSVPACFVTTSDQQYDYCCL